MTLDDPFPLQLFPRSVRDAIVAEFSGRNPTIRDVLSIPERQWLTVPGIGPITLTKMLRATGLPGMRGDRSAARWTDAQLRYKFDRLRFQKMLLRRELEELQPELAVIEEELRQRGIDPCDVSRRTG